MALGDDQGLVSQKREARLRTLTVTAPHAKELGWGWTQASKSERCPRPCEHVCTTEMAPCPSPFCQRSAEDRHGLHDMVLWNPVPFVRVLPDLNPCLGLKLPNRPDRPFSLQVGPSGNPLPVFEFRSVTLKVHFASGTHVSEQEAAILHKPMSRSFRVCVDNFSPG